MPVSFSEFVDSLADLGRMERVDPMMQAETREIFAELQELGELTRENIAIFIAKRPTAVPILATCVGLTQEQLKNQLTHHLKTTGWVSLARNRSGELVQVLDEQFDLIHQLTEQLNRDWTFSDVLLERYLWSRRGAVSAVGQGRNVEDEVEAVVRSLGISAQPRTRFAGRRGATAPCDLAIPAGGDRAQIVIAMKGFNSTGSKLSDAVREVLEMADVRLPSQYVYVVVDGIGWRNRKADLKRIFDLWENKSIDGMYTLGQLAQFQEDLRVSGRRLGMLPDA